MSAASVPPAASSITMQYSETVSPSRSKYSKRHVAQKRMMFLWQRRVMACDSFCMSSRSTPTPSTSVISTILTAKISPSILCRMRYVTPKAPLPRMAPFFLHLLPCASQNSYVSCTLERLQNETTFCTAARVAA